MDVIYETTFEEWVERRRPTVEQQVRVLEFLADLADGTIMLTDLVQVPGASAFQAQLGLDDEIIVVEVLVGDANWCVVSYVGSG